MVPPPPPQEGQGTKLAASDYTAKLATSAYNSGMTMMRAARLRASPADHDPTPTTATAIATATATVAGAPDGPYYDAAIESDDSSASETATQPMASVSPRSGSDVGSRGSTAGVAAESAAVTGAEATTAAADLLLPTPAAAVSLGQAWDQAGAIARGGSAAILRIGASRSNPPLSNSSSSSSSGGAGGRRRQGRPSVLSEVGFFTWVGICLCSLLRKGAVKGWRKRGGREEKRETKKDRDRLNIETRVRHRDRDRAKQYSR